jgi:hypothetical protein
MNDNSIAQDSASVKVSTEAESDEFAYYVPDFLRNGADTTAGSATPPQVEDPDELLRKFSANGAGLTQVDSQVHTADGADTAPDAARAATVAATVASIQALVAGVPVNNVHDGRYYYLLPALRGLVSALYGDERSWENVGQYLARIIMKGSDRDDFLKSCALPADGADTENVFDTWAPVSVKEYAAQPLPERRYLVHGLLPIHGVTVFHGMPGSLKTQLVLDASSCVACGCEWLPQVGDGGGYTFGTTYAPVLWLNFDMADEDIHERAAAVYRTRPLPDGAVFDVVSLPTPWLNLSSPTYALQLAEWVQLRGYGLVVIDNFSNVKGAAKLIDESIADVMLNIRRLSKSAECAVWVIHHETKNVAGKSAFERMYGGVHIAASVEAAFSISRNGDTVTLSASKQRGHMVTTSFSALHTYTQHTDDTLHTFKFFAAAAPDATQEDATSAGAAPLQHELLRVLLSTPLSYKSVDDLTAALGGDYAPNSVRNALTKMHGKGLVMRQTAGKTAMYCAAVGVKND